MAVDLCLSKSLCQIITMYTILVCNLFKRYKISSIPKQRYGTLRDSIAQKFNPFRILPPPSEELWALSNINLELKQGHILGLIGRNGAGKSTLLKILSKITKPTSGYAEICGRIGSLLEVGTGFHHELTGRENIYLNGAMLGMKRSDIISRFDEIVAFAEVEKFIDTPVKRYSTGMYLRLAFAVAAHLETEVLFVDEVLAVGDAAFQRKCLGKMEDVGKHGRTVVFVSHDMTAISRLADTAIVLDRGNVVYSGAVNEAIQRYASDPTPVNIDLSKRTDRTGDGIIKLTALSFFDTEHNPTSSVRSGDLLIIAVSYTSELHELDPHDIQLNIRITEITGHPITTLSTGFGQFTTAIASASNGTYYCQIQDLALTEDLYSIDISIRYRNAVSDYILRAGQLQVLTSDYFGSGYIPTRHKHGAMLLKHEWNFSTQRHKDAKRDIF